jgi:hypothetical protein
MLFLIFKSSQYPAIGEFGAVPIPKKAKSMLLIDKTFTQTEQLPLKVQRWRRGPVRHWAKAPTQFAHLSLSRWQKTEVLAVTYNERPTTTQNLLPS